MCVIVAKPTGIDIPSEDILRKCFQKNSDGAGYMFSENGKVHIKKGFMTFSDFYGNVMYDYERLNGKERAFVLHFRIGTQGSNSRELTHPYPVSKNLDELKLTETYTNMGMAHNGIISLTSRRTDTVDRNDTMAFITDYVSLFVKEDKDFEDNDKMTILRNLLGSGNKLAFLTVNKMWLIGDFTKDEDTGCYFSNTYWKWSYQDYNCGCYNNAYWDKYYKEDKYSSQCRTTYNSAVNKPKKEESTNTNQDKILEGQREIAELLKEDEEFDYDDNDDLILEQYYDSCYDEKTGLFLFVEGDCPFAYEERLDYCDESVCAFSPKCRHCKKNKKRFKKLLKRAKRDKSGNIIQFKRK